MTKRTASCSCGQLTATATGDPVRVSLCHCYACQRRTGGPFGEQARWPADRVEITGDSTVYERRSDEDDAALRRFSFCPVCGATVHYEIDDMPGYVAIPVGAFADAEFPSPTRSIYETRKHAWIEIPDVVTERYD